MPTTMSPNLLSTDGYKFSMAQAGFPLRSETFYLSFRKKGWQYVPFDLEAEVMGMLDWRRNPDPVRPPLHLGAGAEFLTQFGYDMSPAMGQAMAGAVNIQAAPKGSWVWEREPILSVTGPSFLVSWLEPLVLMLAFPIQFATELMLGTLESPMLVATCEGQREIMLKVIDACGKKQTDITVEENEYANRVRQTVLKLIDIVRDPSRVFEVGMRSATCLEQHLIALQAAREAGLTMTSNVQVAHGLGMTPVGTMGHEHIQRWGNDLDAYRAMRDMRTGKPSYLLDTFDTASSGIPAAIKVMRERGHEASIRYDSGDKYGQYMLAHGAFKESGLTPTHILEDGLTADMTQKFEQLRYFTGLHDHRQVYGYGGHIVAQPMTNPLTRDRVSAVYKLTETAGLPRMKWGNETGLGKQSVPGRPVIWRRLRGEGPVSVIGQADEAVPENFILLSANNEARERVRLCNVTYRDPQPYTLSPETQRLVNSLRP